MHEVDTVEPGEQHERENPVPWFMPWRKHDPTALRLAIASLEQCRKDRLTHAHRQEFHAGMVATLNKREARLEAEVERLSKTSKKELRAEE